MLLVLDPAIVVILYYLYDPLSHFQLGTRILHSEKLRSTTWFSGWLLFFVFYERDLPQAVDWLQLRTIRLECKPAHGTRKYEMYVFKDIHPN